MSEPMRDHWWWRTGWRSGRSFYTWHVTFGEFQESAELVNAYAPALDNLPGVGAVPLQWLHLTMQGLGFTDEVNRDDVDRIVAAARTRCAELAPFTVEVGPAAVDPEALLMPVQPVEPLAELRMQVRAAIGDVWSAVPEPVDGFTPHVSLGYSNAAGPSGPARAELQNVGEHTAKMTISSVALIDLNRDNKAYEWTSVAKVDLGVHATA